MHYIFDRIHVKIKIFAFLMQFLSDLMQFLTNISNVNFLIQLLRSFPTLEKNNDEVYILAMG